MSTEPIAEPDRKNYAVLRKGQCWREGKMADWLPQPLGNERRDKNMTTKEKIKEIIDNQPDDATYEEIVRELAFSGMVERGLKDARDGRVISNDEMGKRIRLWQK